MSLEVKPPLNEALLLHYGVKGMKWGVVNNDESSGDSKAKAAYLAIPKPHFTAKERNAKTVKYGENFVEKFAPSDESSGLSPQQKKALIYGVVGGIAVAAIIGGTIYAKKQGVSIPNPGLELYNKATQQSRLNAINADFITKQSFDRKAFTLPAGHTFHRISGAAETGFGRVTYASHSPDDFNRYVSQLGHSLGNRVTFKSKGAIKVPSLTDALETLRESMSSELGRAISQDETLSTYREIVGGKWDHPLTTNFFSSLTKKGFSALVDEMDAGVISESPLVIFNHGSMGAKTSKRMTMKDIQKATSLVKDFSNRK